MQSTLFKLVILLVAVGLLSGYVYWNASGKKEPVRGLAMPGSKSAPVDLMPAGDQPASSDMNVLPGSKSAPVVLFDKKQQGRLKIKSPGVSEAVVDHWTVHFAARNIAKGHVLTAEDIRTEKRRADDKLITLSPPLIQDIPLGSVAKDDILKRAVLTKTMFESTSGGSTAANKNNDR